METAFQHRIQRNRKKFPIPTSSDKNIFGVGLGIFHTGGIPVLDHGVGKLIFDLLHWQGPGGHQRGKSEWKNSKVFLFAGVQRSANGS